MKYLSLLLFLLGGCSPSFAQKDAAQAKIDSLEQAAAEAKADSVKATALCRLCGALDAAGKPKKALARGEAGLALADSGPVRALCLNALGNLFLNQGKDARALMYFLRARDAAESAGAARQTIEAGEGIARVHMNQDNFESAGRAWAEYAQIARSLGDSLQWAIGLVNIGTIDDDPNVGLDLYRQALPVFRSEGHANGEAACLNNIGGALKALGQFEESRAHYDKSLAIRRKQDNLDGAASTLSNLAKLSLLEGDVPAAVRQAREAWEAARASGSRYRMMVVAKTRAEADSAAGDYRSAYSFLNLRNALKDSVYNLEKSKEVGRLAAQYDFEKEIAARERAEKEAARRRATFAWIAAGAFGALLAIAVLFAWGFRTKRKANLQLSAQNDEIKQQSEEILRQRDELQTLNDRITEQRDVLEKAHEEITDSIDYASRIQHALLPSVEAMRKNADVYVYYNARDVVSGDFYWTHRIDEDAALYAAADCTGHGVPGAFMSVLGATTLDTIVREYGETRPDKMLGLLDQSIRQSLKQDENKDGSLDGMDLALIKLDKKNRKLYFSSAGRPLFLLRNGEILEYKGANFPAGGAQHGEKAFPLIEIDLKHGDRIFMCSDGVTDQFGGPRKRKFSPKRLKETLLAHQDKPLQTQGAAFAQAFNEWQKNAKQLDDQLLIGLGA